MPAYDYQCESHECGRVVEVHRKVDDRHAPLKCPHCNACCYLRVVAPAFSVKGGTPKFHQ